MCLDLLKDANSNLKTLLSNGETKKRVLLYTRLLTGLGSYVLSVDNASSNLVECTNFKPRMLYAFNL